MSKTYKIVVGIFAIIFSLLAVCIGFGLVGDSKLTFLQRFGFDFVFMMQFLVTIWYVIAGFRKVEK